MWAFSVSYLSEQKGCPITYGGIGGCRSAKKKYKTLMNLQKIEVCFWDVEEEYKNDVEDNVKNLEVTQRTRNEK